MWVHCTHTQAHTPPIYPFVHIPLARGLVAMLRILMLMDCSGWCDFSLQNPSLNHQSFLNEACITFANKRSSSFYCLKLIVNVMQLWNCKKFFLQICKKKFQTKYNQWERTGALMVLQPFQQEMYWILIIIFTSLTSKTWIQLFHLIGHFLMSETELLFICLWMACFFFCVRIFCLCSLPLFLLGCLSFAYCVRSSLSLVDIVHFL